MQFETLLIERRDGVARITLNRPRRLNALYLAMPRQPSAAASSIEADPETRAVVLTGAGRAFCSGADLMGEDLIDDPERGRGAAIRARMLEHFNPMVLAFHDLR